MPYYSIPIKDDGSFNLGQFFGDATEFLDQQRAAQHTVLVHGMKGMCRPAAILAAYLVRYKRQPLAEALAFLQQQRAGVNINPGTPGGSGSAPHFGKLSSHICGDYVTFPGFMAQLAAWEKQWLGQVSVTVDPSVTLPLDPPASKSCCLIS